MNSRYLQSAPLAQGGCPNRKRGEDKGATLIFTSSVIHFGMPKPHTFQSSPSFSESTAINCAFHFSACRRLTGIVIAAP